MPATPNGNGTKSFGGVVAIVALITGIAAIVRPMQQSIDSLQREIDQMKAALLDHSKSPSHIGTIEAIAAMQVKFTEIETQFKASDSRVSLEVKLLQEALMAKTSALEQALQAESTGIANALQAEAMALRDRNERDERDIRVLQEFQTRMDEIFVPQFSVIQDHDVERRKPR